MIWLAVGFFYIVAVVVFLCLIDADDAWPLLLLTVLAALFWPLLLLWMMIKAIIGVIKNATQSKLSP